MDQMKKQIHQRLVANLLMDKCRQREHLIFQDSWCSQDRVIRFTTPFFRNLFPIMEKNKGKWKTGDEVMYEVENSGDLLCINCIYEPLGPAIMSAGILQSWTIADAETNGLLEAFDRFLDETIPTYEKSLEETLNKQELLTEGEKTEVFSVKYERNPKARALCLAHYGYNCRVCGMSFEDTYGSEFKNIIEVHHIVPVSQIGESYVVDPINDLIPVCPNCHTAIHSKAGGQIKIRK